MKLLSIFFTLVILAASIGTAHSMDSAKENPILGQLRLSLWAEGVKTKKADKEEAQKKELINVLKKLDKKNRI